MKSVKSAVRIVGESACLPNIVFPSIYVGCGLDSISYVLSSGAGVVVVFRISSIELEGK